MQVQPLPPPQIAVRQISKVLTCLQISSRLLVIMQKGTAVGGGPAPSSKAHYNCLSRPHKSCISIICSKQPAIRSCKQGFWMQSQTIKMFHECIRERSSELALWIHKTSFFLISSPFHSLEKKKRKESERGKRRFGLWWRWFCCLLVYIKCLTNPGKTEPSSWAPRTFQCPLLLARSLSQHNGPGAKISLLGGS